jgi:hypothetical protein
MIYTSHITDPQRMNFMQKLSAEVFGCSGVSASAANLLILEDWEKGFLSSWRASSRPSLWFIGGRKEATDKLWRKYGLEINYPFPVAHDVRSAVPAADPNGCEFLVKNEAGQINQPCNEPATLVNSHGFRYCDEHGQQARNAIKHRGVRMELRTYLTSKSAIVNRQS